MNCLPIRFFHAFLSGVVIVLALAFGILSIETPVLATPPSGGVSTPPTTSPPSPSQAPTGPLVPPTPSDLDGDGIPNAWETENSHNPNDFTDSARDFDKDGLTALQEYQLSVSSGGAFGNPLGKWKSSSDASSSFTLPQSYLDQGFQYVWPSCANDQGEIAVGIGGGFTDSNGNWNWRVACALIKTDGSWLPLTVPGKLGGNTSASDMDENGSLLLQWQSEDGSQIESYRYVQGGTFTLLRLNGKNCWASRMNNHGDWIGWSIGTPWTPVYVVNGRNVSAPNTSTQWQYLDINDYGEVMGSYYDPLLERTLTFLEYGPYFFSTGRPGDFSFLDGAPRSWIWPGAINNWGEFTGGTRRNNSDGSGTQSRAFFYDGAYCEINPANFGLADAWPVDVSDHGQVLLSGSTSSGQYGAHLWSDHISVPVSRLWSDPRTLYPYKLTPSGDIILTAYDSSSGSYSIISLCLDDDTDGDGMPDDWEAYYGLNPNLNDANADFDRDGTNNLGEFLLSSNPTTAPVIDPAGNPIDLRPGIDTDGDGIPNTWEWSNGLNYNDASDAPLDFDRDGFTNLQEFRLKTDPRGAPSYRIREIGPFPGASSVSLSSTTLGNGSSANLTECVFFTGTPSATSGSRPASWSLQRQDDTSAFSFFPAEATTSGSPLAQSIGGASLFQSSGNPNIYQYWTSPTSTPVSLSGAAAVYDAASLSNSKLSPSGVYLVATRRLASNGNSNQPIVWKMPVSGQPSVAPVRLLPPAGITLSDYPNLFVNDHGFVVANGTAGNQSRPVLWKIDDSGTAVSSLALPALPAGTWAIANGLSNQASPLIVGTSTLSNNQQRAVVWNSNGLVTNLGTLTSGNTSVATQVSPGGMIAGSSNVLVGTSLKFQPFVARFDAATTTWQLQAQGEPQRNSPSISSINDAGEVLGTQFLAAPVSRSIPTLWRHGRAFPLADALPISSGYTLASISAINASGTLLASTWKNGARTTVILTPDRDTDGDGLPDAFENQNSLNPFVKSTLIADTDSDGLTDLEEYRNGTNLRNPDSDGDGMKDGWEVSWGLLPLDPSDADLDPDNDRVTNLRESQIGTTPTGIYQVKERLTDTSWTYPTILSIGDSGKIVYVGQTSSDSYSDEDYSYNWSSKEFLALPSTASPQQAPQQLPPYLDYGYEEPTYFEYQTDNPNYWVDSISGSINATLERKSLWSFENGYSQDHQMFLIPDIENNMEDESSWISWNNIIVSLKQGSSPPLAANGFLNMEPVLVSPSATRRIHRSGNSNVGLILNESGQFVRTISLSTSWRLISDQGLAVYLVPKYIPPTNGVLGYYAPELRVSSGVAPDMSVLIPHTPGKSPNYTLGSLSNDGKVLLSRSEANSQFQSVTKYFVFDIGQQTLTPARQPNLGSETINLLSLKNQRLVGSGPKPFQITPDGTCVRLDALRIKASPTTPSVPFGTLYAHPLTLNHITSDGRITATMTDAAGRTTILQIVPHNDADGNGMPDDWQAANNLTDSDGDADNDGLTNLNEFLAGTDVLNQDSDGDAIPDALDSQPLTSIQKFADADDDGIPDNNDPAPNNSRGPKPSVASETAAGNPIFDVATDALTRFVVTVNNPAGSPPGPSDFTLYLNGTEVPATLTAIAEPASSSGNATTRRFLLSWMAKVAASYPAQTLQNVSLRFKDSQYATSWLNLARIDVAEWEGMIAGMRMDASPDEGVANQVKSHYAGKYVSPQSLVGPSNSNPASIWYRGPKTIPLLNTDGGTTGASAAITGSTRYPLFIFPAASGNPQLLDVSNPDNYPDNGSWYKNHTSITFQVLNPAPVTVSPHATEFVNFPLPDPRNEFNMAFFHVKYTDVFVSPTRHGDIETFLQYISRGGKRSMNLINFQRDNSFVRVGRTILELRVGATITPHTAGSLENPGVPITTSLSPLESFYANLAQIVPIQSEQWHKLVLKVGPDAGAVSNGITLKLGRGENGGESPQTGFSLQTSDPSGFSSITIPPDGTIEMLQTSDLYQKITSIEGLTLFLKRDSTVTEFHRLGLDLVPKQSTDLIHRIAAVDLLPVEVVPDYNRDGKIELTDRGKVTTEKPWCWWVNDDNDFDSATGGDTPEGPANSYASPDFHKDFYNSEVDGMRDLIDFFPLHLDIKTLLAALPRSEYQYFIKHSDSGFKLIQSPAGEPNPDQSDLSHSPNSHFTDIFRGSRFANYAVNPVTPVGVLLSNNYLTQAANGKGLLLLEATKVTTAPLQLEIRKGTQVVANIDFPVKISNVEDMFRHVDLTQVPKNYDGSSPGAASAPNGTKTADPGAPYPDTLTNGKYFVFLHGFNVPVQRARGWNAEIFKRLHQMGSKARFVGVTWTGATGVPLITGGNSDIGTAESSTDYHKAVFFALQTGLALKSNLSFSNGADLTIAAHSLGNMVVGEAIENGGLVPNRYYIINGAVAREAYDSTTATTTENIAMTQRDWKPFGEIGQQRLYAANWYNLFDPSDSRNKLTWKNHFAKVRRIISSHNFYSPGDDVVQDPRADTALSGIVLDRSLSRGAWVNQELMKGTNFAVGLQSRVQGGWGFNFYPQNFEGNQGYVKPLNSSQFRRYLPEETAEYVPGGISLTKPQTKPFFDSFIESGLFDSTLGSSKAAETKVQQDVLACGVPSMSYAIAVNPVASLAGNYNMEAMKTWPNSWPTENHEDRLSVGRWLHSDFRDVALNYLHRMYKKMIDLGELNQ